VDTIHPKNLQHAITHHPSLFCCTRSMGFERRPVSCFVCRTVTTLGFPGMEPHAEMRFPMENHRCKDLARTTHLMWDFSGKHMPMRGSSATNVLYWMDSYTCRSVVKMKHKWQGSNCFHGSCTGTVRRDKLNEWNHSSFQQFRKKQHFFTCWLAVHILN
jgi:hypothetical protein